MITAPAAAAAHAAAMGIALVVSPVFTESFLPDATFPDVTPPPVRLRLLFSVLDAVCELLYEPELLFVLPFELPLVLEDAAVPD